MYYISKPIKNMKTLTPTKIRRIVAEDEFDVLATECGELGPGEANDANWLAFHLPTRCLVIANNIERCISGLVLLASINAGVADLDIDEAAAEAGIIADEEDEAFDPDARYKLIPEIFRKKCEEKQVSVCIAGFGEVFWDEDWEKQILEVLVARVEEWDSAEA